MTTTKQPQHMLHRTVVLDFHADTDCESQADNEASYGVKWTHVDTTWVPRYTVEGTEANVVNWLTECYGIGADEAKSEGYYFKVTD